MAVRAAARQTNRDDGDRRDLVRSRLLAAVERLLSGGATFPELSIATLAAEAGISRSNFYLWFAGRSELLEELVADVVVTLTEAGGVLWALPPDAKRADVERAVAALVDAYREHRLLLAAVVDTGAADSAVRVRYEQLVAASADGLAAHIRRGQADGSVAAGLPPADTAEWLVWMAERGLHQILRQDPERPTDQIATAITAIVWRVLYEGARG